MLLIRWFKLTALILNLWLGKPHYRLLQPRLAAKVEKHTRELILTGIQAYGTMRYASHFAFGNIRWS